MTLAPGFGVGHWTGTGTGVTVILCPEGTIGSGEIRGGAPATRETALLEPERTIECVDAVVFSGGSAFGLAAADGVVAWLVEHDRGFPTTGGRVPIVPAAAIYDLVVAGDERVGAAEGRAAIEQAANGAAGGGRPGRPSPEETPLAASTNGAGDAGDSGLIGAGRGATVGKWRGPEHACAGGLGVATQRVGDAALGAIAVVNAVGDVVDAAGAPLACSAAPPGTPPFPDEQFVMGGEATTLVAVATDASLTKAQCHLLAQSGHVGIAHAVRPSHTRHDGDLVVALASGTAGEAHLDRIRVAAVDVIAEAVRTAVRHHDG